MDLELAGKSAVVTGASKGIGLAVVRELAAEDANVVAGARNVDALAG
jgi:NAD(P)-dependent dehydrogenase (short-subunit alcohol dehydrogenase family)